MKPRLNTHYTIEEIAEALGVSVEEAQARADAEGWPFIEADENGVEPGAKE